MTTEQLYIKLSETIKHETHPIRRDLEELKGEFRSIQTIVKGNGSKGHEQRLEEMERWKLSRPMECPAKPLSRSNVVKRRMLEVSVMALFLSAAQIIISQLHW